MGQLGPQLGGLGQTPGGKQLAQGVGPGSGDALLGHAAAGQQHLAQEFRLLAHAVDPHGGAQIGHIHQKADVAL